MGDPSSRISKQHLTTFWTKEGHSQFPITPHQLPNPQFHNRIKNVPPTLLAPVQAKTLHTRLQSVPTGPPLISPHVEPPSQEDPHLTLQFGSPNQPQNVLPSRTVRRTSNFYSSPTWKWNGTEDCSCSNMLLCFQYLLAKISMDKYMTYDL